jgi:hypothetical protein
MSTRRMQLPYGVDAAWRRLNDLFNATGHVDQADAAERTLTGTSFDGGVPLRLRVAVLPGVAGGSSVVEIEGDDVWGGPSHAVIERLVDGLLGLTTASAPAPAGALPRQVTPQAPPGGYQPPPWSGAPSQPAAATAQGKGNVGRGIRALSVVTSTFAVLTFIAFAVPLEAKSSFVGTADSSKALAALIIVYLLGSVAGALAVVLLLTVVVRALAGRWATTQLLGAVVGCTVLAGLARIELLAHGLFGANPRQTATYRALVHAGKAASTALSLVAIFSAAGLLIALVVRAARGRSLRPAAFTAVAAIVWVSVLAVGYHMSSSGSTRAEIASVYASISQESNTFPHPTPVITNVAGGGGGSSAGGGGGGSTAGGAFTDNCQAGYGYLDTQTNLCYAGSGPGANNDAGGGKVASCYAPYRYYNAATNECFINIPGSGTGSGGGSGGGGSSGGGGGASTKCRVNQSGSEQTTRIDTPSTVSGPGQCGIQVSVSWNTGYLYQGSPSCWYATDTSGTLVYGNPPGLFRNVLTLDISPDGRIPNNYVFDFHFVDRREVEVDCGIHDWTENAWPIGGPDWS